MLSEAYGGEAMKKSSVFEWHKMVQKKYVEITNEDTPHHFFQYEGYCSL
jgi:hypothetical protein